MSKKYRYIKPKIYKKIINNLFSNDRISDSIALINFDNFDNLLAGSCGGCQCCNSGMCGQPG